jgi:hypothetical protein
MRNLAAKLCLTIGVLLASPVHAETVIYCQSELATGFVKKNDSWVVSNFVLERWTLKFSDDYSKLYGLDKSRPFICAPAYTSMPNSLACLSGYSNGESFIFNKEEYRFIFTIPSAAGGYSKDHKDTDIMYAGTCNKF